MLLSRIKSRNKIVAAIILAGLLFVGLLLFLRGQEDTWLCQNGEWIMHGKPASSMPTSICE